MRGRGVRQGMASPFFLIGRNQVVLWASLSSCAHPIASLSACIVEVGRAPELMSQSIHAEQLSHANKQFKSTESIALITYLVTTK